MTSSGRKGPGAASGALWSAGNNIVMRVAAILVTAVVARLLSPDDFGVFALASAVFVVVASLGELGLGSAITRSADDPDRIAPTVTTLALVLSTGLAAGMAVAAPELARLVGSPEATDPIRVLSICLFLSGIFAVPGAQMAREFRQRQLFIANMVGFVPANVVLVILAEHGSGAMAFAWSRVVGQVLTGVVVLASVGRRYAPGLAVRLLRPLLTFGLPLAVANLVNWTLLNADYVIIGHALDARDVGIYMAAFTVAGWSTAVMGSALNSVVVPALARVEDDPRARGQAVLSALRIVALIALPIGALTLALADPIVLALYGSPFAGAAPVLRVLAGYGVLYCLTLLLVNILVAAGRTGRLLVVQLAWLALLAPGMTLAVRFGLVGVAWVHIVVITAVVLPGYLLALRGVLALNRVTVVRVLHRPLVASLVAAVLAAASSRLVGWSVVAGPTPVLSVLVGGIVGGGVYVILVAPVVAELVGRERLGRLVKPIALAAQRRAAVLPVPVRRLGQLVARRVGVDPASAGQSLLGWDQPLVPGRGGRPGDLARVHATAPAPAPALAHPPSMEARRVLVATGSLDAGGMDAFADFLARGLRQHGMMTEVLVAADALHTADGRLAAQLRRDGFTVHRADSVTIGEVIQGLRPDVVSVHGVPDWAVRALSDQPAPLVETLHGLHLFEGADPADVAARSAAMTSVASVSETVRRQYLAAAPAISPASVVTIPNGVPGRLLADDVRPAARDALGLSEHDVLFVSLARFCLQKNTYGLLVAFDDVARQDDRVHLLVAGRSDDDAYLAQVVRLRDSLPTRARIHLRDHFERPSVLLAAADAFVLDSFFEGWALSSMEALTAGVPVVLSEVAGAAEQLDVDDPPGLLVANPLGDPLAATWPAMAASRFTSQTNRDELSRAMLRLAEDIDTWHDRRARIAQQSTQRFDPAVCLARHAGLLEEAVSRRQSRSLLSRA